MRESKQIESFFCRQNVHQLFAAKLHQVEQQKINSKYSLEANSRLRVVTKKVTDTTAIINNYNNNNSDTKTA